MNDPGDAGGLDFGGEFFLAVPVGAGFDALHLRLRIFPAAGRSRGRIAQRPIITVWPGKIN